MHAAKDRPPSTLETSREKTTDDTQSTSHFEELGGHDDSGRAGYSVILRQADPDTPPQKAAKWCLRAQAEGVL